VTYLIIATVVLVGVLALALGALALVRRGGSSTDVPRRLPAEPTRGRDVGGPPEAELPSPGSGTLAPTLERPSPVAGRLRLLRDRLSRSQSTLGKGLLSLLSRDRLDEATWEEIEDTLLAADVGVGPTHQLVERLRTRMRVGAATGEAVHRLLREELVELVDPSLDRQLRGGRREGKPGVVMVVGVNGVGKTTTVGKIARVLVADDLEVLLGAADTFRAAAADQLQTWGERVGVATVRGAEGSDPASVAFEAVRAGVEKEVDTVLIDTAGRLHTKTGLMDELGKVKRVVEKLAPVDEVLLVIDATTGQNGLTQARIFAEVVDVTGIVLTKLDGTAKVGLGEGPDDLAPFEAAAFVDALLGNDAPSPAR